MSKDKKMSVRQWALVERDPQGKKTVIDLSDAQLKLVVKQGHGYALLEKNTDKPVIKVTLKRKGDSLIILDEDQEVLVDLQKYYSEEAVTWSQDGSFTGVDIARALPIEGVTVSEGVAAAAAPLSPLQWGAGALAAAATLGGGGGNGSAPATQPEIKPFSLNGNLQDDYIAYAQVFADLNGNGKWDEGEPLTQTDAKGNFSLEGVVAANVNLIAVGGIDIASGVPNNIVYRFNLSAAKDVEGTDLVISPVSTLITAIAEALAADEGGVITAEILNAAAEKLSQALNLNLADASILLNIDAVKSAYTPGDNQETALDILSLSRQISVVVAASGALINGADEDSTNVGTVVATRAIANLLINGPEGLELDFTNALDVETMVQAAMDLANSSQVTTDLKATTPADLQQISQILSDFNQRIEQATEQETNGISADSLAAMVAVNDLMIPLLQNSGSEAASEREGDISLATILMQFKDTVAEEASVADYVDSKITAQKSSVIYAFGSIQSVAGYVDDYVPLGIQLPAMEGGKIVDKVYLNLAELAAQTAQSSGGSANVEIFRFDPLTKQYIELEFNSNSPTLEVSAQHVGYLYVRTDAPLVAAKVNGVDVFKGGIEIPIRATFTEGGQTANFTGELSVEIRNRPLDIKPKVTSVSVETEVIPHNTYTNNNDDPFIRGVLNQNLPAGDEGRYYAIEIYEDSRYLGLAVVDVNDRKKWSFEPQENVLSEGAHTYTARITFRQPGGALITLNSGSLAYTINVDTLAPIAPAFDVDADRVFEGTAEPGTTVTLVRKAPANSQEQDEVVATVLVDKNGQWTYTPDSPDDIQVRDKFYAYTTDAAMNSSSRSSVVTVTPTGSNSEPVIGVAEDELAVEGDGPITGQLTAEDADGDQLVFSLQTPIDGLTLNEDGSWTFDTANANLDFLGEGEEYPVVVTYVVTDEWGGEDSSSFTITVKGTTPSILSVEPANLRVMEAPSVGDTVTLEFTVSRDGSRDFAEEEVVAWTLTGLSSSDFEGGVLPSGTVSFAEGSNTATISVEVPASLSAASLRTAVLTLENPGAGYVVDGANEEATMTLIDSSVATVDTLVLTVSADQPVKLQEGAEGDWRDITYTVSRSGDISGDLRIGYALQQVGAALISGSDFANEEGLVLTDLPSADVGDVVFAVGEREATITVRVRGDDEVGPLESFNLVLTGLPSGARVQGQTYGEISNDDVYISVAAESIEGAGEGEVTHQFVVTRSGATEGTHTVYYTLQGVGEQASELFSVSGRQELVFEAGETEKTIVLESFEAQTIAGFQTFSIELEPATGDNVTLVNAKAVAGIIANLQDVELSADIDRIAENSSSSFSYTVTRSGATDKALTLNWSVDSSGENSAAAADFEGSRLPTGQITFAAGDTTATINFKTRDDLVLEGDQGFTLKLEAEGLPPGVRILTPQQEGFVVDNESAVGFGPESSFSVVEGDDGSSNLMVEVTRIGFTGDESTVEWRVSAGTANLSDFAAGQDALGNNGGFPSGVLTLQPGESLGSVAIRIAGDGAFESGLDETLSVTLSNPSAGTKLLGTSGAMYNGYGTMTEATILNDDSMISVVTTSKVVTEGQGGTDQQIAITIQREGSTVGNDWVKWSLTSTGSQAADNEDLGQDNSAVAVFNSHEQSWIDIAKLSGTQSASGTITLPKSGYIMVAYNRDLEFDDYNSLNIPFDQFLLKNLSISEGATITSLGSVMDTNFIGNDLVVGEGGVLFYSEEGRLLPDGVRQVTLTADGDLRGLYFKVTGEDPWGNDREEYVKASNEGSVATTSEFGKVTEVSLVPAKVAIGSLHPAQNYYEEHNPDDYFDDLEISLKSGQLFNTGDNVDFGVNENKQGARWATDGDTTYLTLTSDADLTGIDFLVTGGILIAKFDRTDGFDQDLIDSSPSYEQAEVPGGAQIRAEQLSGLYQGEDGNDEPSYFEVTGRTASGERVSEIVAVQDFDAAGLASVSAYTDGNLLDGPMTLDTAGRVVFSAQNNPEFDISPETPLAFTVIGTDITGKIIKEVVTEPQWNSGVSFATGKYFKTITEISANHAFTWDLEIGHTQPVDTVNAFVQVYGVAPVDASGNALENNEMQSSGRIEFTVPKQFVIEGGLAGVRLSAEMVNYIDTIEVLRPDVSGVKVDIGYNQVASHYGEDGSDHFLVDASTNSSLSGSVNTNVYYYGNTNEFTDNPTSYDGDFLAYAIFKVEAPTDSAAGPVTLSFDMAQVGRYGIDTGSISYAPDGTWSTGLDGLDDNEGINLLLPVLRAEPVLTALNLDFFSNQGEYLTDDIFSIKVDYYSYGVLYINAGTAGSPNWIEYNNYRDNVWNQQSELTISRQDIEAGKLAYSGNYLAIGSYLYESQEAQDASNSDIYRYANGGQLTSIGMDFFSDLGERDTADIYSIYIDDTDDGRLYYNSGTSLAPTWEKYWDYKDRVEDESGADLYISRAEIEAGKLAYIGENDFEIEAYFYDSAEAQDNDEEFDYWTSVAPPVAMPAPEPAVQQGSVALEGSGYIWIRYNNNDDSDNDGADKAFIHNLHVDGGATLSVVGQKVIKDGVVMEQELGAAGELSLDGAAVSHRFTLPENFDGNLIVYVSANEASAHLQNGVYRVVGQNADGDTVERYGSWGTTDNPDNENGGGFQEGQSIVLQGLDDLVSIESIRVGEYSEQLKNDAGWGEDSPYELYDPELSFTTGNLTSLAENLEIPLNRATWYGEDVESDIEEYVPGAPVDPWADNRLEVGLPEYENILLGSDESEIVSGFYPNSESRVVLTTSDNLTGRSFVITGRDANDNELTETLTFGEGDALVYTEAKFASVSSIVSNAGESTGHVSVGQSYDYVASMGEAQVLMAIAWEPEEPSFTVSGFDTAGQFQQVTITDLGQTQQRVLGAFSEILAFQADSGFDDFYLYLQPVPEAGYQEFVEIELNKATRGDDGLIDLGGMQRVVISGGSASRGLTYKVIGEDAQGHAIEEEIEGIATAHSVGEDDFQSETAYASTEQYFAKIDKILVTNWHVGNAETLPILSIGTVGVPIAPDQSLSRYGQEAALGFPVACFDTASRLSFSSEDNLTDRVFTITGTLADGRTVTETVTGPNNGMALSAQAFMTVTKIMVDEGGSGAVKVGYVSSKGGLTDNFVITGSGTADDPYQGYSTNTLESYLRYENSNAYNQDSEADVLLYVDFKGAPAGTVNLIYDLAVQGAPTDTLYVEYSSNINSLLQGRVEFADGEEDVTLLIPVLGDDAREANESMTLTLTTAGPGATVVDDKRTSDITILNDDDQVTLSATAKSTTEGNSSDTDKVLSFTITRLDTGTAKTVRWHLAGLSSEEGAADNAADEEDFVVISDDVTFAQDSLTATIEVKIKGDRVYEGTETFRVVLTDPEVGSGYSLGTNASAQGTVTEDDVGISITADEVSMNETDGQVSHTFTVTRVGDLTQTSALRWSVSGTDSIDDIDVSSADFGGTIPTNRVLNFAAGESSYTFSVDTVGDNEMTGDSAFTVTLTNASGDTSDLLDGATADGLIVEDDAVNLSMGSGIRQIEGSLNSEDVTERTYTLTRADASQAASYEWELLLEGDGVNFTAGSEDFAPDQDILLDNGGLPSGTAVFAAGELTTTIKVKVANDNLIESDEAFKFNFKGLNAPGADSQKIDAYLVNDTVAYRMQVKVAGEVIGSGSPGFAEGQTEEGEDGMTEVEVTFLRAGDTSSAVTLTYSLLGVAPFAMEASDFKDADGNVLTGLPTNESITFGALQNSVTRTFRVSADSLQEENETFTIVLKNGASETVASQTVQVRNDDAGLVLEAQQLDLQEGSHLADVADVDKYSTLTFTVIRSGEIHQESTVNWSVKAQDGITAADFFDSNGALPSGTLTFASGDIDAQTITIQVLKDSQYEGVSESLVVELSNASVGTQIITSTATTEILDDDKEVGFSEDTIDQMEAEGSPTEVTMVNGTDFVELTYTVVRTGNDRVGQQSVTWTLSGDGRNGDAATVDSYDNYSGWSNTDVFGWDSDTNARVTSGTLVFADNDDNVKTITIRVHKDHYQENPEAFKITLSGTSAGLSVSATDGVATGVITDDDIALVLDPTSATRVTKAEGQPDGGSNVYTEYSWVINREGVDAAVDLNWSVRTHSVNDLGPWVDAGGDVVQNWWTQSVTADSSDFSEDTLSGTLSFAEGETSKTLTIRVLGDEVVESTETFQVHFTKPANVGDISGLGNWSVGSPTESHVEGVVLRDEGRIGIVGSELDVVASADYDPEEHETLDEESAKAEGNAGFVSHFFKIYRDFTMEGDASIDWCVEEGPISVVTDASPFLSHAINTSALVDDFMTEQNELLQDNGLPSGRVTIPDGEAYVIIEIKTKADLTAEDLDSFRVRLSNPSAGSTLSQYNHTSVGYLANDDHPLFSVGEIVPEGDNTLTSASYGSKVVTEGDTVTYTVYRSGSTEYTALVDWAVVFPDPVTGESTTDTNSASNYTANASDFTTQALSGTLTFNAGESSKTITLQIRADSSQESWAEAFSIALSDARWDASVPSQVRNAATPAISAVAGSMESIIVDGDEPMATVAVSAVTRSGENPESPLFEGADRTITYTLTKTGTGAGQIAWKLVLPNNAYGGDVTGIEGDTSAQLVQDDGRAFATGLVAFGADETVKTVVVHLRSDGYVENDENFVFTLIDGKTVLENGFEYGNAAQKLNSPWVSAGDDTDAANSHGIDFLDASGNIPDSDTLYRDPEAYQVTTLVKNDDGIIVVNNVIAHPNNIAANVFEGDEGDTVFTASITRNGRLDHDITVDYVVLDSTDTVIADSAGTWTLSKDATVSNGNGSKTYTKEFVLGQGDTTVGDNQSFKIRLTGVSDPSVRFNQYTDGDGGLATRDIPVTVVNDDTIWSISDGGLSTDQEESDDGAQYSFTITRPTDDGYYKGPATVTYKIAVDDAEGAYTIDGNDIVNGLGERTVSFDSGQTTKVVTFSVKGDQVAEFNETFKVELVSATQGEIDTENNALNYTIVNDDTTVEISAALPQSEGDNTDANYLEFNVVRKGQIENASSTVTWTVQDGTATKAGDLTLASAKTGVLSFDAGLTEVSLSQDSGYGEQTQVVRVYIQGDATPESSEKIKVSLSAASDSDGIVTGKVIADGEILNDDASFSVNASEVVKEGQSGQTFTITRTHLTAQSQTVTWSIDGAGDHAADSADFAGSMDGSVTFGSDELSVDVFVAFSDDTQAEFDETFIFSISGDAGTSGDTFTIASVDGTIENDDATLSVSFEDGNDRIREGSGTDTHMVEFVVARNFNTDGAASATWTLSGAAVTAGLFATTSGTVTFANGEDSQTVQVAVTPNAVFAGDKDFTVTLSAASGAQILVGQNHLAEATIVEDDSTIGIRGDAEVLELNSDSNVVRFELERTGSTEYESVVGWRVINTANPSNNTANSDFVNGVLPSGTLTLSAGVSDFELSVPGILGDLTFEGDETFRLELFTSGDTGLSIDADTGSATGTILNNEARVDISSAVISSGTSYANATEYEEGSTITFTVTRTGYLGNPSSVTWDVAYKTEDKNGTGDFVSSGLPSGTVYFNAGESEKTITVNVRDDDVSELNEVFRVKLLTASEGTSIGAFNSFFKVMNNDDDQITLSAGAPSLNEGDGGAYTTHTFTLTRENPWINTTVDWAVEGSGSRPLDIGRFEEEQGTATFALGQLTTTIEVKVLRDDEGDFDREFKLTVSNPTVGAVLVNESVWAVVLNDDPAISIGLTRASFVEGSGTNNRVIEFNVVRTGDTTGTASVRWDISSNGETGTNIADFGGYWPTGVTVFNDGESLKTIQVALAPDAVFEPTEGFKVVLSNLVSSVTGAKIVTDTATGTITNDDTGVFVRAVTNEVREGESVDFTISAEGLPNRTVKVFWVVEGFGLSPANADDFNGLNYDFDEEKQAFYTELRLDSYGEAEAFITVSTAGDNVAGIDENFRLRVVEVEGGTIAQGRAEVTIQNDDSLVGISTASVAQIEGGDDTTYTFTVTRTGNTSQVEEVFYTVEGFGDNPATEDDFVSPWSGSVVFAENSDEATITLTVNGDSDFESDESFVVRLSEPDESSSTQIEPSAAMAVGVLRNDDSASLIFKPLVAVVKEGTESQNFLSYEIIRNGDNSQALEVSYTITGASEADFDKATGLLFDEDTGGWSGSLTMTAGQSRAVLKLGIQPNEDAQLSRSFDVAITAPGFDAPEAVSSTIVDDDSGISVELLSSENSIEDDERLFEFVVTRKGDNLAATTVEWELTGLGDNGANASDLLDGQAMTGSLVFEDGEESKQVVVKVRADDVAELTEALRLTLLSSTDGTQQILVSTADAYILDDDAVTSGNDVIQTGMGSDRIEANDGDDLVYAGGGADRVYGGDGDDTIHAQGGADVIFGESGDDTVVLNSDNLACFTESTDANSDGYAATYVNGGIGDDTLVFDGEGMDIDLDHILEVGGVRNFETIVLGSDDQTLELSIQSLRQMQTMRDSNEPMEMRVTMEEGVNDAHLRFMGQDNWTESTSAGGYAVWTHVPLNATLYIDLGINVLV